MRTELKVITEHDYVTVQEANAEPGVYKINEDSLESMEWDIEQAVSDYLQGLR